DRWFDDRCGPSCLGPGEISENPRDKITVIREPLMVTSDRRALPRALAQLQLQSEQLRKQQGPVPAELVEAGLDPQRLALPPGVLEAGAGPIDQDGLRQGCTGPFRGRVHQAGPRG